MSKTEYLNFAKEVIGFLDNSPVSFIAVNNFKTILNKNSFSELNEFESWNLNPGDKCYTTRNGSSIIAFKVPENGIKSFSVTAAHSDSPGFKIKPRPDISIEGRYIKLNVEKYGGMICSTWLDRPLSVAGRVAVRAEAGVEVKTVNIDRDMMVIPNLAIHMNSSINNGYKFNAQKDMLPLFCGGCEGMNFTETVADAAGVAADDLLGADLFLYNRDKGTVWGRDNEFFSAARIDDLECAYTAMMALVNSYSTESVQMCCIFDNEEVGSGTKQGARSTFMYDVMLRISKCFGMDECDMLKVLASSFMLSADNGHALHPNFPEISCPTNRPYMNGGVLIKYNAAQKYTTDGVSEGIFKKICDDAGIPYQEYVNRSDMPGGSTLGNLSSEQVSINTIDIGTAQLAMHSAYETAEIGRAHV